MNEYQSGRKEFDDLVYLVTDDVVVQEVISQSPTFIDTVMSVFEVAGEFSCDVKRISHRAGRLWVELATPGDFVDKMIPSVGNHLVPLLDKLNGEVAVAADSTKNSGDPLLYKTILILAMSSGLAITGLALLVADVFTDLPFLMERSALIKDAIYWGIGIVLLLLFLTVVMLGKGSRSHLVMLEVLLVGSFGAIATVGAQMNHYNIEWDESPASFFRVEVEKKKTSHSRRGRTKYHLYFRGWPNEKDQRRKVAVSWELYSAAEIGSTIEVGTSAGALGYEWVESLRLVLESGVSSPQISDTQPEPSNP